MTNEEMLMLKREAEELKEQNDEYEVLLLRNRQRLSEIDELIKEHFTKG